MFRFIRRLRNDLRGIAAVEFALLAPVMVGFYLGVTEICQAFMAQKRMGHVASMVADLISQDQTASPQTIDDAFAIGSLIMKPFDPAALSQRVSSVTMTNGVATVDWSYGHGMNILSGTVTLPPDLITNGESIIMAEAVYDYDSPVDYVMPAITKFSHRYYLRPRVVQMIPCSTCPAPQPSS